ncbi:MAG: hypothetical protein ACE5IL_00585 [Myxococcota bacterium]
MLQLLLIALVTGLFFSPAESAAKDLFRYETEGGTLSFTDNPRQVPARYRATLERLSMPTLAGYDRLTVVPRGATSAPAIGLAAVPSREAPSAAHAAAGRTPRFFQYGLGGQTALELPLASDEPVRVRRLQWRRVEREGLSYWKAFTVIEQGGRTLAEIEPN